MLVRSTLDSFVAILISRCAEALPSEAERGRKEVPSLYQMKNPHILDLIVVAELIPLENPFLLSLFAEEAPD
jgi:hypothetical protein